MDNDQPALGENLDVSGDSRAADIKMLSNAFESKLLIGK
jgi:hypothetical protein